MPRLNAAALLLCLLAGMGVANAKPLRQQQIIVCNQQGCGPVGKSVSYRRGDERNPTIQRDATIIGGRPADCPHAYCGCGLRKFLGLSDKRLDLALNWKRLFPRVAGPAVGMAAVRPGHVMYIEASAGEGRWLIRDYNSGGGLSRLHVRDVRGYVFVNPHSQIASR